jgi:hypothetical protein
MTGTASSSVSVSGTGSGRLRSKLERMEAPVTPKVGQAADVMTVASANHNNNNNNNMPLSPSGSSYGDRSRGAALRATGRALAELASHEYDYDTHPHHNQSSPPVGGNNHGILSSTVSRTHIVTFRHDFIHAYAHDNDLLYDVTMVT